MTVIKQVAITSTKHLANLRRYLDTSNPRHDVLAMDSQHLISPERWEREMDRTREAYGHNIAGRKGAKCTYLYHQIIAFNPDECDVNGGKVTPEFAMAFAREWVERYYPAQECAWALHREHCREDGTDRYAVHIAINRTNLETGRRLDDGKASRQKALHASRMREMDERHGLSQLERGAQNSMVHERQRTAAEQRALDAGRRRDPAFQTDNDRLRATIRQGVREVRTSDDANKMRALAENLERKGVKMHLSTDKRRAKRDLVFSYRTRRAGRWIVRHISGYMLGRHYTLAGIAVGLGIRLVRSYVRDLMQEMDNSME